MDFRQRLQHYQELAAHVRALESQLEAQRQARLARLPADFGFPDLASFVRALRSAAAGPAPRARRIAAKRPAPVRPALPQPVAPAPAADAPKTFPAASAEPPAVRPEPPVASATPPALPPPPAAPAIPARPTGTTLDDPTNFGLMPDRSVLRPAALPLAVHRERMAEALRFATRVLHTSKVPAAVWREWRQFERQLSEALRATVPTPDIDVA